MKIETKFSIRQKVFIIELDRPAGIVSILLDGEGVFYNCRWFNNGDLKTGYLMEDEIRANS